MIAHIAGILAPLMICTAIGYVWGRGGHPFEARMVTALSLQLGVPCLIFSTLTRIEMPAGALAAIVGGFAVALALMLAVGALTLWALGLPRSVYLPSLAFSNTGNMGLPVCLFAFGEPGLALALPVFVASSIASFVLGMTIYSGRVSAEPVLRNPLIYATLAASAFLAAGAPPPAWLANTTTLIGGMGIPLMILSLGVSMSRLDARAALGALGLAVFKLALGLAAGISAAALVGLDGLARDVLVLQCAMPTAVHNYLFAARYDRAPERVAGLIVATTLLALAALPALLAVLL